MNWKEPALIIATAFVALVIGGEEFYTSLSKWIFKRESIATIFWVALVLQFAVLLFVERQDKSTYSFGIKVIVWILVGLVMVYLSEKFAYSLVFGLGAFSVAVSQGFAEWQRVVVAVPVFYFSIYTLQWFLLRRISQCATPLVLLTILVALVAALENKALYQSG